MSIWSHLFTDDFEYPPPSEILAGPLSNDLGVRPEGVLHSLYQELFHAAHWQRSMLQSAKGGDAIAPANNAWPESPAPESEDDWATLVGMFLEDAEEARALGEETERLEDTLPEGITRRERLELLAVHNAYHLGKIVSLRQFLGLWPAPAGEARGAS
jgi:uncharacterized damage-inducible protein DinB